MLIRSTAQRGLYHLQALEQDRMLALLAPPRTPSSRLRRASRTMQGVEMKQKQIPAEAKPRECTVCHQTFRPMTDALWTWVRQLHERLSLRHQRAIGST